MRAWATRAYVATPQHFDLSPLPFTGTTAEAMAAWSSEGIRHDNAGKLARMCRAHARGDEGLAAAGYAVERRCGREAGAAAWNERGGALPRACRATGRRAGHTSGPCGAQARSPHARPRAREASEH